MSPAAAGPGNSLSVPVKDGIGRSNPILVQALGICSALAVTALVNPTLVMGAALIFVASLNGLMISLLRNAIPHRVRLIVQMLIISVLVILVHLYLRAYHFEMSETLGPYVGLIITNCIILGRSEGFALRNGPLASFLDGIGQAAGYALILLAIAVIREPLGSGTLCGLRVLPETFPAAMLLKAAPGAFITMGVVVWVVRAIWPEPQQTEHPESLH
ncbi:MAG: NADH:ubiquinone reductase (Na(+)-transporting) subunit D [Lentisphaeria bacterium]|nr:NADH:ubiquinone reductase (Na(+)-transporting) subunit D [Lentisphaeria bacterium]